MERNLNLTKLKQDPAAERLVSYLTNNEDGLGLQQAHLYHLFPLYRDQNDWSGAVRLLIASPRHGILLIDCPSLDAPKRLDPEALSSIRQQVTQVHSQVFARLITSPGLRRSPTELNFPLVSAFFLPDAKLPNDRTEYDGLTILASEQDFFKLINDCGSRVPVALTPETTKEMLSVLEGSRAISRRASRRPNDQKEAPIGVLGDLLDRVESRIATFDSDQKRATMHTLAGPQRIRGLAGSGKTVVLSMKAALLHLQDPDAVIVYTYWTKNLHGFIKDLISRFFRQFAPHDPDWSRIQVMHAWGGRNLEGLYSKACRDNSEAPMSFMEARAANVKAPFDEACRKLIASGVRPTYDYCILDEAQDFPAGFYQLAFDLTKAGNVIWGYDECQNILDVEIPDPKQTFGVRADGSPRVLWDILTQQDELRDVVLHKCYRNPRSILFYAFGIGLGIQNQRVLQLPQNNDHWQDLGFTVLEGSGAVGATMVIERPKENSPLLEGTGFPEQEAITWHGFEALEAECQWVSESIAADVGSYIQPEDILVICLDEWNTRNYFSSLNEKLHGKGISTFDIIAASSLNVEFCKKGLVTLSSVYRAKGNEAGCVYVVGVDAVFRNRDSIVERNKLFTAFTRAKLKLAITGLRPDYALFEQEIGALRQDYPILRFQMPHRSSLRVFQRGLEARQARLNELSRMVERLAKEFNMSPDDVLSSLQRTKK